jgi:hypothetical protein
MAQYGEFVGVCILVIVGVSYIASRFATMQETQLVYYTITDRSTSAQMPL